MSELVPSAVTGAILQAEEPGVLSWAARHGWAVAIDLDQLLVMADLTHPADGSALRLVGDCTGFRAVPPAWTFVDPDTGEHVKRAYPKEGSFTVGPMAGKGLIFHTQPVICAPWNRLAFKEGSGPHAGDWGSATAWLTVGEQYVRAPTIGEMLAVTELHLRHSTGRMA